MDESVNPCSDFYEFACGNFIRNTVIPEDKSAVSTTSQLRDDLNLRLKRILESDPKSNEPDAYRNVRNIFQSCMDTRDRETNSVKDLKDKITEMGGWPVLEGETWDGDKFKWWEMTAKSIGQGFTANSLIYIFIAMDEKDTDRFILNIGESYVALSSQYREYFINGTEDKIMKAYLKYMVDTAVFLGADRDIANQEMKDVLDFQIKLAMISLPREDKRNFTRLYHKMIVKEVSLLYPEFPWVEYINSLLPIEANINIDDNEEVIVKVPKYIKDFAALISTIPTRTIGNLIMWGNVQSSMGFLNNEARDIDLGFYKAVLGYNSSPPQWELCLYPSSSLGHAIGAMYVKENFSPTSKDITNTMVGNIMEEFDKMIYDLEWMDDKTKLQAYTKLKNIVQFIGYPEEILNDKKLDNFYNGLQITKTGYLYNNLQLQKWKRVYDTKKLLNNVSQKSWELIDDIAVVNAFYGPQINSINIPAGILGGVFFHEKRPLYMNYGGIGYVIGHEISHGFDDQGSQRDENGNLVDWWAPKTKKYYQDKVQCIIEQYGNYTVDVGGKPLNLNGINTQGENIADNGGIKAAFHAYTKLTKRIGQEPSLPGLPYSPRQMFWISAAQQWCTNWTPSMLKNKVITGVHSPGRARVNLPLANMDEFSQDWNCPSGSSMNPVKKCEVW